MKWVAIRALFGISTSVLRQLRAAVEPNSSLLQNTPISWWTYCHTFHHTYHYTWICILWCVNQVTVFKFLVYSVNNTRRPLLYIISPWMIFIFLFYMDCSNWRVFQILFLSFAEIDSLELSRISQKVLDLRIEPNDYWERHKKESVFVFYLLLDKG